MAAKPIKPTRYDTADYLETPEDIACYLEAVFEDGDPALIAEALGAVARSRGMTKIAKTAGVTREALYRSLKADGDPRISTFIGVLGSLGLKLRVEPATNNADAA